ncbi:MAG TPA: copper chaperone PCu(A)C [Jatrophihabitantaceae bacterium]|nr:copper chaperone PCu(A)C [Jatrophihabitantaceae bacterium]
MTRARLSAVAAALAGLAGFAGLIRGAVPLAAAGSGSVASDPIVVSGAYVREPASPDVAAAYFTVYNTTAADDTLTKVSTGAGADAELHANGSMTVTPGGLRIPAHSSVTLSPGKGHVMIERIYGTLKPGQTVDIELDFAKAGPVIVSARVISIGAPAPTAVPTK